MSGSDPDPREGLDPRDPGGLIEGGPADIPGVQDRGPADAAEESEASERADPETAPDPTDV